MGEKTFNLTWNNHLANLSGLFEALYRSGSLTDATLACQGGMLRAHRLVLAACSPYFERVFKEHCTEQPILILKGVAVEEMECLLDFMYKGSIDVAEENLPSLIKTATDLEIRGLSGEQNTQENSRNVYTRVETRTQRCHIETREIHTTEYIKDQSIPAIIPFLPKHSSVDSLEDHIKVEDIEVEDDPMVIDHEEDSFDELPQSPETQIKRLPPPMYKRETRFKGQKRVSVGRMMRHNDPSESKSKDSSREPTYDDPMKVVKFNEASANVTVSGVQETSRTLSEPSKLGLKRKIEMKRIGGAEGKEGRISKSEKAQNKPFSCDLCTLAFTRASHLARHRRVHTGERPFVCGICSRKFARQDKLKQHQDSHSQWPRRKGNPLEPAFIGKVKRGRPRKHYLEQTAIEEILEFGEFSSLLNKSHSANSTNKSENSGNRADDDSKNKEAYQEEDSQEETARRKEDDKNKDNQGCQVENGQDIV